MKRLSLLLLVVSACGTGSNAVAVVASAPGTIGVGEQRVLVAISDQRTAEHLASPEIEVVATLRDRTGSPLGEDQGEFVWVVPDVHGLYSFHLEIPSAGTFQVTLEAEELGSLGPVGIVTFDDPPIINPGEQAPRSVTRTIADFEISDISSDPNPDPRFYEMSVDQAVSNGPSVIIFATPAWCTTHACGPLLDQVKTLSASYQDLNYVHVEVWDNIHAGSYEELELVPAVDEWRLPSEPWVFVVDDTGVVVSAFEGAASDAELADAFSSVTA